MAATISSSSVFPNQQQQQLTGETDQRGIINTDPAAAVPRHYPSGSIGPFFAVISVLIILAVLSCFLGRMFNRGNAKMAAAAEDPLEMIRGGGWWGRLRRKWRRCLAGDIEAGAKVADCDGGREPHHENASSA